MLVKLEIFPKDRGENKKYVKPLPNFNMKHGNWLLEEEASILKMLSVGNV